MRAQFLNGLRCIVLACYVSGTVALETLHRHDGAAAPGGAVSMTSQVCGDGSPHAMIDPSSSCPACTHGGLRVAALSPGSFDGGPAPSSRMPHARKNARTAGSAFLFVPQRSPPAA